MNKNFEVKYEDFEGYTYKRKFPTKEEAELFIQELVADELILDEGMAKLEEILESHK